MRPVRLQLSRRKGFDLQSLSRATNSLEAVKIDRSTGFGNPFPIAKGTKTTMGVTSQVYQVGTWEGPAMWFRDTKEEAAVLSVQAFSSWITHPPQEQLLEKFKAALRGKNLACWCKPNDPCHADVLLELANKP